MNYDRKFHFRPAHRKSLSPSAKLHIFFLSGCHSSVTLLPKLTKWGILKETKGRGAKQNCSQLKKVTMPCNSEHNNFAVHSKIIIKSKVSAVWRGNLMPLLYRGRARDICRKLQPVLTLTKAFTFLVVFRNFYLSACNSTKPACPISISRFEQAQNKTFLLSSSYFEGHWLIITI